MLGARFLRRCGFFRTCNRCTLLHSIELQWKWIGIKTGYALLYVGVQHEPVMSLSKVISLSVSNRLVESKSLDITDALWYVNGFGGMFMMLEVIFSIGFRRLVAANYTNWNREYKTKTTSTYRHDFQFHYVAFLNNYPIDWIHRRWQAAIQLRKKNQLIAGENCWEKWPWTYPGNDSSIKARQNRGVICNFFLHDSVMMVGFRLCTE